MDTIPGASQIKSFIQFVADDKEGAKTTQARFSRQCIGVSQMRSFVELIMCNYKAAKSTQKTFLSGVYDSINAIPLIGHVKGGIHYAKKDKESGHAAMKSASRATGVVLGGAAGLILAGYDGATYGGILGAIFIEIVITAFDTFIHDELRPYGILELIQDPKNRDKWIDAFGFLILDGITGVAAGFFIVYGTSYTP